jgi:hypothetical protein
MGTASVDLDIMDAIQMFLPAIMADIWGQPLLILTSWIGPDVASSYDG